MVWLHFGMNTEMSVAMVLSDYCFLYTSWWYWLSTVWTLGCLFLCHSSEYCFLYIMTLTLLYVQVVLEWRLSGMVKVGEMNVSNVAWMVFPVNCDDMGFLRYGQRDISLYNFGVNTIFCTLCDDIAYRQRNVCFYNIDMNTASATHCADMGHLVYGQGDTSVPIMLTWRLLQVHVVWACLLCGMENVKVTKWLFPGDPLNFNGSPGNNHGNRGWYVCMMPPQSAPTARSDRLLKQSAPGSRAVCFKSSSQQPATTVRPRPAPTARSDRLLKQSAPGIRAVCFKSSSQQPVTTVRPRPAPTARSDELLQQSAPGIRAVCFKSPSRRPVTAVRPRPAPTARSDELLQQIGARNLCRLFQKSVPAARHGRPSTDVRHGPLSLTSETNGAPYCRSLREVFACSCFFVTTDLSQIYNRETRGHGTPCTKTTDSYLFSFLYNNPRKIRRETTVGKFAQNAGRR